MSAPLLHRLRGHLWTVIPSLASNARPVARLAGALHHAAPGDGTHFEAALTDPRLGPVRVTGEYHRMERARDLLVVIHGLGGSIDSPYMARPAHIARARGASCLRLNLRGADRQGDDIYHAGLTQDLDAVLAAPALERYQNIFLLGFSLGGHMALRWALEPNDRRVRALSTVCSPLDLAASRAVIDRPRKYVYRRHLLEGLRAIHAATDGRGRALLSTDEAAQIRTLGEWDERVVAPRFGFRSAEDYWREMSVGPHLADLGRPCLLLATDLDPMVTADTLKPSLANLRGPSEVRWVRGGHVGFPSSTDVETLALDWMLSFRVD